MCGIDPFDVATEKCIIFKRSLQESFSVIHMQPVQSMVWTEESRGHMTCMLHGEREGERDRGGDRDGGE